MTEPVADPPVTIMVSRTVLPANRQAFEAQLRALTERSAGFPGHLGVSVFRPVADEGYRILFKFDSSSRYEAWRGDSEAAALIAGLDALTENKAWVDTLTGLETWFTLPSAPARTPPRRKMAMVTWGVLFPLVSVLLTVLRPLLDRVPFLAGTLIVTGVVTLLMTYVIMPRLTRLLAPWLFGTAKD